MVGELLKTRLLNSIGKEAKIFLLNSQFRFFGEIVDCDGDCVEVLDYKSHNRKLIRLDCIADAEIIEPKGDYDDKWGDEG